MKIKLNGLYPDKKGGSWEKYWKSLETYSKWDAFTFSSADFNNPLYKNFVVQTGIDISQFKEDVKKQKFIEVSMGVWQYSNVMKDTTTDQLYLQVPQSGCAVYFKIFEEDKNFPSNTSAEKF
jgi:hypothetical protein